MIYKKMSRRMFLQGTGSLLSIPLLESLLPQAIAQAMPASALRYVQLINPYSPKPSAFYGTNSTGIVAAIKAQPQLLQTVSPDVRQALLSALPTGDLGVTLGPELSALRNKISILRGLDAMGEASARTHGHCFTLPTCASPSVGNGQSAAAVSGHESIDVLLSKSLKTYPANFPTSRRLINLGPPGSDLYRSYENASFSWNKSGNELERLPILRETQALADLFKSNEEGPQNQKLLSVMNKVHEDYTKVRNNRHLASSDKTRLDNYMDLLSDIQNSLTQNVGDCSLPTAGAEPDAEKQFENQARILAAAMSCDLTRVASVGLHFNIPTEPDAHARHHKLTDTDSHENYPGTVSFHNNIKSFSKRVAFLINTFDGTLDKDGHNLLDNSVIYWGMEFGLAHYWGQHSREDYPVMLAGGGGGKLRQGHYVDYRKYKNTTDIDSHNGACTLRGVPINNLLVTLMATMGLDHTDYELNPGQGFGYYPAQIEDIVATNGSNVGQKIIPNEAFWHSTAGRRSTLPFIYTG